MALMHRATGKEISDLDHLRQSINDILTTARGSRIWVRTYGCGLFFLVDRNITPMLVSLLYGAIAEALDLWEPRLIVTSIKLDASFSFQGMLGIDLEGIYVPDGRPITLTGLEVRLPGDRQARFER